MINFDTLALKKYNMQLYVKRNLFLSDVISVQDMAEGGRVADKWEKYVTFFAEVAFYLHVTRILINFLKI